ncbi:MAG: hypothetical protein LC624_02245, partial [Halobacteriales archaeon]|nr:hypothetical protein [Halobacteriales archaeon]
FLASVTHHVQAEKCPMPVRVPRRLTTLSLVVSSLLIVGPVLAGTSYYGNDIPHGATTAGRAWMSAASDSQCTVSVFGGYGYNDSVAGGFLGDITDFDFCLGTVDTDLSVLQPARANTSAVLRDTTTHTPPDFFTDEAVFIFGGVSGGGTYDKIVAWNTVELQFNIAGTLPTAREETCAIWDDHNDRFYVFGGRNGATYYDDVVEFNPGTGSASTVAHMSNARAGCSVVFVRGDTACGTGVGCAYVFGGRSGASTYLNSVDRFTPGSSPSVNGRTATFGCGIASTSATLIGSYVYVFGGDQASGSSCTAGPTNSIAKYDYANDQFASYTTTLQESVSGTSQGVCTQTLHCASGHAFVFGGKTSGSYSYRVEDFTP